MVFAQFVFYPYGGATATPKGVEDLAAGRVVLDTSVPVSGTTPVHPTWVGTGARRTATTFSTTYLDGWSVASQSFVDNAGTSNESEGVGIDVDHWDGAGNFTYTGDRNSAFARDPCLRQRHLHRRRQRALRGHGQRSAAPCGYLTGGNQGFGIYDSEGVNFVTLEKQMPPTLGGPFRGLFVPGRILLRQPRVRLRATADRQR